MLDMLIVDTNLGFELLVKGSWNAYKVWNFAGNFGKLAKLRFT